MSLRYLLVITVISVSLLHADSSRNWKLYTSEDLPSGKIVSLKQAAAIANETLKERIYLVGDFSVTAWAPDRIVLRTDPPTRIRLVVEYPKGYAPPAEGSKISRDAKSPYLVINVLPNADGQTTVYARECMKEK